jgi:hypothetical protein
LYIELLTYLNNNQENGEWTDLAGHYRQKLSHQDFYSSFKEEIDFLTENGDIKVKGNLSKNPDPESLELKATITEEGEEYLRSYKFAREENQDKYSTKQIVMLMLGIAGGTVLLGLGLAYFFG